MSGTPLSDAAGTWNERLASEDYVFGTEPNEYRRARAALLVPGGRASCVADSEGRDSV